MNSQPLPITTITGWRYRLLELQMLLRCVALAWKRYPNGRDAWYAIRQQIQTHLEYQRVTHLYKAVKIGADAYAQLTFPKVGSAAMEQLLLQELHRHKPVPGIKKGLNTAIIAITKKCALQCAHCFEWENLNQKEQLSAEKVITIIQNLQQNGIASIELSGGEPLNRFADLCQILEQSDTTITDFWLLSSGYRLTADRAAALKSAGLVGVCLSLDHWDASAHDAFRGMPGSFDWVMRACQHARAAGLVVCFSLTTTKDMCHLDDLMRYAELAKTCGAAFIRLLEPRAVGHFSGKDVQLGEAQIAVLEDFAKKMQTSKRYRHYPVIDYYAAYQRAVGCSGGGQRFLYIDTDGDYHACPFCQHKCGNACDITLEEGIHRMQAASGCHVYNNT